MAQSERSLNRGKRSTAKNQYSKPLADGRYSKPIGNLPSKQVPAGPGARAGSGLYGGLYRPIPAYTPSSAWHGPAPAPPAYDL
eukprot:gene25074-10726_t